MQRLLLRVTKITVQRRRQWVALHLGDRKRLVQRVGVRKYPEHMTDFVHGLSAMKMMRVDSCGVTERASYCPCNSSVDEVSPMFMVLAS